MNPEHRYVEKDRGLGHVHRWAPSCSCGWVGVYRRRREDAAREWRETHKRAQEKLRARRGTTVMRPRKPTPSHLLPEALR